MRNGREIIELQNTPSFLRMLKAQRWLYSEAKHLKGIATLLCVALPMAITFAQIAGFFYLSFLGCALIEIGVFASGSVLLSIAKCKTKTAASIQQRFDFELFGLGSFESSHLEKAIVSASKRYEKRSLSDGELENWYASVRPDYDPIKAIRCCQSENISWSYMLSGAWLTINALVFFACLAAIVCLTIAFGLDFANLFFAITIVERIVSLLFEALSCLSAIKELRSAVDIITAKDRDSILRIQNGIYRCRESGFTVPDWFFQRMRSKCCGISDEIAELESARL